MMVDKKEIIKKVKEWLSLADEDLVTSEFILTSSKKPSYRIIAFHAQQCAEKCLKAFLVFNMIDFPYTHNIEKLLILCKSQNPQMVDEIKSAAILTDYSITTRYPGLETSITGDEAKDAVRLASKVRDVIRGALISKGLEF